LKPPISKPPPENFSGYALAVVVPYGQVKSMVFYFKKQHYIQVTSIE